MPFAVTFPLDETTSLPEMIRTYSHWKRDRYLKELGLHIMSPKEFVDAFESEQDA